MGSKSLSKFGHLSRLVVKLSDLIDCDFPVGEDGFLLPEKRPDPDARILALWIGDEREVMDDYVSNVRFR